jgi:EAL domain-containing protein (putative c-di-GMP-specific phosphodiesterase class I)
VVETIKLFADKENIKTVAEFVHCKEVFDVVKEIGIDYMQGFYLGEPELELAHDILNKEDYS